MEIDRIRNDFLRAQLTAGLRLSSQSDVLTIHPLCDTDPPERYILEYRCPGLVELETGEIAEADLFAVGVRFPANYLRDCSPPEVLTWLGPINVSHPNVRAPHICIGQIRPATRLVELAYRVYDVIVYANFGTLETDSLNPRACAWVRANLARFPLSMSPLKRAGQSMPAESEVTT